MSSASSAFSSDLSSDAFSGSASGASPVTSSASASGSSPAVSSVSASGSSPAVSSAASSTSASGCSSTASASFSVSFLSAISGMMSKSSSRSSMGSVMPPTRTFATTASSASGTAVSFDAFLFFVLALVPVFVFCFLSAASSFVSNFSRNSFQSNTASTLVMATSIMLSSGSRVVSFWSRSPGFESAVITGLVVLPASRMNSYESPAITGIRRSLNTILSQKLSTLMHMKKRTERTIT